MKRIYLSLLPCLGFPIGKRPRAPKRGFPCLRLSVSGKRTGSNPSRPLQRLRRKSILLRTSFHLENELRRTPGTKQTFFDKVSIFLSNLQDGHTYLLPPTANQQANQRYLALEVRTIPDGIILQGIPETYKDLLGSRITTINGDSLEEVLARTAAIQASETYMTVMPIYAGPCLRNIS